MTTCFVIQPFDSGKFDKRFDDVYKPAIKEAGLEAYRVDRDPSVDVPIDAIEQGIRNSLVCLADITTDNPNVWYELGFAFALGKPVVMLCGDERTGKKYPFDIQHRTVTPYQADSPSDFATLKTAITKRLKALSTRDVVMKEISKNDKVAPVEGLTQPELIVLASAAGSVMLPGEGTTAYLIKSDVERSGFTSLGFVLGVKRLVSRGFVNVYDRSDYNGETYQEIVLTEAAWDWIEQNESRFIIQKKNEPPANSFNDIPF
ncbi:MAG: hypothetical protein ACO1RA_02195 [Planctomycetaceae bacterium]